jgi:hypothetical protein
MPQTPDSSPAGEARTQDLGAVISGTAATATVNGPDLSNGAFRGIKVVFDVTAVVAVGSFTVSIQGKDNASGKYYTLLAGAAVTTAVTNVYTVYPGIPAAANVSANDVLPKTFRVIATYNSGTSSTFTVGVTLLP